ncbi:uncharacterized protein LOC135343699 isoform X2 [Halichondria panicea]|uniref:uncharacterized protein LOC135343699 isoform X2 n=1 Tax=Halichondria panicea TaxID=6063 RepID=UPI00312B4400
MNKVNNWRCTVGVQATPGLGQRVEGCVYRKTPVKRRARVETGVCGKTVLLRTPKKLETPRRKRVRASTVQEMHLKVPMPVVNGLVPSGSSLVVKSNPLYTGGQQGVENENPESQMSVPCDGARNPTFYGQRKNIRKTKEQEMITAIVDLVQYGERFEKKTKTKSIVRKAKTVLGRRRKSSRLDITKLKSPDRKGAFFLRPRQRSTTRSP